MSNIIKLLKGNIVRSMAQRASKISDKIFDKQYFRALDSGNPRRVLAVRDLHFKGKSGNDNEVFAHSTHAKFTEFDKSHFGETDEGFNGKGFYFATSRVPENQSLFKIQKGPHGEIPTMNYGPNKMYVYLKGNREFTELTGGSSTRNFFKEPNTVGITNKYLYEHGRPTEIIVGNPKQIKSAYAITYDDAGNIIPISLRDNFSINDIRYKEGGSIKSANARKWKHKFGGIIKALEGLKIGNFLNSDTGKSIISLGSQLYNGISSSIEQLELNKKLLRWKQSYINSIQPEDFSLLIKLEEERLKLENPDYNSSPIVTAYNRNRLASNALIAARQKASQEADLYIQLLLLQQTPPFGDIIAQGLGTVGTLLSNKKLATS